MARSAAGNRGDPEALLRGRRALRLTAYWTAGRWPAYPHRASAIHRLPVFGCRPHPGNKDRGHDAGRRCARGGKGRASLRARSRSSAAGGGWCRAAKTSSENVRSSNTSASGWPLREVSGTNVRIGVKGHALPEEGWAARQPPFIMSASIHKTRWSGTRCEAGVHRHRRDRGVSHAPAGPFRDNRGSTMVWQRSEAWHPCDDGAGRLRDRHRPGRRR